MYQGLIQFDPQLPANTRSAIRAEHRDPRRQNITQSGRIKVSDKPIVGLEQFGSYRTNAGRLASNVHPGIRYCIAIASLRLPAGRLR